MPLRPSPTMDWTASSGMCRSSPRSFSSSASRCHNAAKRPERSCICSASSTSPTTSPLHGPRRPAALQQRHRQPPWTCSTWTTVHPERSHRRTPARHPWTCSRLAAPPPTDRAFWEAMRVPPGLAMIFLVSATRPPRRLPLRRRCQAEARPCSVTCPCRARALLLSRSSPPCSRSCREVSRPTPAAVEAAAAAACFPTCSCRGQLPHSRSNHNSKCRLTSSRRRICTNSTCSSSNNHSNSMAALAAYRRRLLQRSNRLRSSRHIRGPRT
mmetsp:Transcript_29230/g.84675  ORF Transcript_29230/g.84675 Transcript_29230/m.84675 type:complete len:269 (+) Transcript_29230:1202-2008(+)